MNKNHTRLYVGRLDHRTRERDLERAFDRFGHVARIQMKAGFAFVVSFQQIFRLKHRVSKRNTTTKEMLKMLSVIWTDRTLTDPALSWSIRAVVLAAAARELGVPVSGE